MKEHVALNGLSNLARIAARALLHSAFWEKAGEKRFGGAPPRKRISAVGGVVQSEQQVVLLLGRTFVVIFLRYRLPLAVACVE